MKTTGRTTGRRVVAAGITMLVASGAVLASGLAATAQDEPGTDANGFRVSEPDLGGFQTDANMTPFTLRMYEPVLPVPVGPGQPQGELALQYTRALVGTGPASRGLSSSFWLGAIVGDGFPALCSCDQEYPFKADAKYPDGPYDSTDNSDTQGGTNAGMQAFAHGLDASATAQSGGQIIPGGVLSAGFMDSSTTSSVKDGVAAVSTQARIANLDFMDGLVKLDEFQSRLSASSDGEVGTSDGEVVVQGLTIAGQPYRISEDGVISGEGENEEIIVDFGGGKTIDLGDIGVEVTFAGFSDDDAGPAAARATDGLLISLDLSPIKEFVDSFNLPVAEVIGMIPLTEIDGPLGDLGVGGVPENPLFCSEIAVGNCLQASMFTLATLSPRVDIVLGFGSASAVATTPFNFDFPSAVVPPAPSSPGTSVGTFVPSTTTPTFSTAPAAPEVAGGVAPAPAVAPQEVPVALAADTPLSSPIGTAAVILGLIGAAVLAQGLSMLGSSVVGPMGATSTSASQVPDLRSF